MHGHRSSVPRLSGDRPPSQCGADSAQVSARRPAPVFVERSSTGNSKSLSGIWNAGHPRGDFCTLSALVRVGCAPSRREVKLGTDQSLRHWGRGAARFLSPPSAPGDVVTTCWSKWQRHQTQETQSSNANHRPAQDGPPAGPHFRRVVPVRTREDQSSGPVRASSQGCNVTGPKRWDCNPSSSTPAPRRSPVVPLTCASVLFGVLVGAPRRGRRAPSRCTSPDS